MDIDFVALIAVLSLLLGYRLGYRKGFYEGEEAYHEFKAQADLTQARMRMGG